MTTLKYYYVKDNSISEVIFEKYTIDATGIISNKKTGKIVSYFKSGKYNRCCVYDNYGRPYKINVGRAIASTFIGPPPSPSHTADHIDQDPNNDTIKNIRWLCKKKQNNNRTTPSTFKSAFVIIKDGVEKTAKEWVGYFKDQKNTFDRVYTKGVITTYAVRKKHGFSYKEYPDLPEEVWKRVEDSENSQGRWEISNMNRVKYITNHAENVFSDERLNISNDGYPRISVNGKEWKCHVLVFKTFFPEVYATKKTDEFVLHEHDDKRDFRPNKLRLGTCAVNSIDALNNGKRDCAKTMRLKCISYIDGILEKEHDSQTDAVKYLKSIGFEKASAGGIRKSLTAFRSNNIVIRYSRSWRPFMS